MTTLEGRQTAIEWARQNGVPFRFRSPLDNHEPARRWMYGGGWFYYNPALRHDGVLIENAREFPDAFKAGWLIDTGDIVKAYYAAGWHHAFDYILLHQFPTDASWTLGPRRYYHLKVAR